MRERICRGLESLGIIIDGGKNQETVSRDGFLEKNESLVKVAVIVSDEMKQMADETAALCDSKP